MKELAHVSTGAADFLRWLAQEYKPLCGAWQY